MKKAVLMSESSNKIKWVYDKNALDKIKTKFDLSETVFNKSKALRQTEEMKDVEAIFCTWGMAHFSKEEITMNFPSLKYVFYAAGSVQGFAKEFLDCGVRVFSAWRANAVPVAENTFAQIVLANKGYFKALRTTKISRIMAHQIVGKHIGNYKCNVGLIGVGTIGKMVAIHLKAVECNIFAYDPFLSKDVADSLNITLMNLKDLFKTCHVISNHLANKPELDKILNFELFNTMKPYSTFLNTGRGKQVDEKGLIKALRKDRTKCAVLDVTSPEPPCIFSPLRYMPNIFLTPHLAGSLGHEVHRMSMFMADTSEDVLNDKTSINEVTQSMLQTMA